MRIKLGATARNELRHLSPVVKKSIRQALDQLEKHGLDATELDLRRLSVDNGAAVYRLRVGSWRIVFVLGQSTVEVVRVFPRSEGYAWMERPEKSKAQGKAHSLGIPME